MYAKLQYITNICDSMRKGTIRNKQKAREVKGREDSFIHLQDS